MAADAVHRALERADMRLLHLQVVESLAARREARAARPGDEDLVDAAVQELLAGREPDGSRFGSLTRTAELLHDVRDLLGDRDPSAERDAVAPSIDWLLARRNAPGAFGSRCDAELHRLKLCSHAVSGFYAPAPDEVDLSGLTLQHGARFTSDTDARIGASSLALAAVQRWGAAGGEGALHLDALRRLVRLDDRDRSTMLSSGGLACVAFALLTAPQSDPSRAALVDAAHGLTRSQRGDGSWPDTDMFFVLSVVLRLIEDPECATVLVPTIERAARLLALLQQPDGNWGRQSGPWRLLTGWRVLRLATGAKTARGFSATSQDG